MADEELNSIQAVKALSQALRTLRDLTWPCSAPGGSPATSAGGMSRRSTEASGLRARPRKAGTFACPPTTSGPRSRPNPSTP